MADAVPMVVASIEATDTWAAENAKAGERVPPATGRSESTYRDVTISAAALAGTGWEEILALRPRHRVEKQNYQLVWGESQIPTTAPSERRD